MTVAFLMLFGFVFVMDLLLVIAVYTVLKFEHKRKLRRAAAAWKPDSEKGKEKSTNETMATSKKESKSPVQGNDSPRPGSKSYNNRRKSSKCAGKHGVSGER